jgi:hypothetical protein
MRENSAFGGLAWRMGLVEYWRKTGKLPDFCTDPERRAECIPQLRAALKR